MTHLLFSSLCLLAFWWFYKLALENISWHRFKRFYLLGILVISAVIPLLVVKVNYVEIQQEAFFNTTASPAVSTAIATDVAALSDPSSDWTQIILLLYTVGFVIMAVRFGRNLWSLRIHKNDEVSDLGGYMLVLKEKLTVPCSFMDHIYVPKNKVIPSHIIDHEKAHLDQRHSWDILLMEVLLMVFWFHPLLYLIKYSITLNHEFLADQSVLKGGFDLNTYQKSLLEFISQPHDNQLAHTYNFPIIKKRFTIMNTRTNTTQGTLRSLAFIPLLALLIISCGKEKDEVINTSEDSAIYIDNNSKEGTVSIEGVTYNYSNDKSGIKIYDHAGNEINYNAKGWDIRERLVVPDDQDLDDFQELYTGIKKGSKIFIDGKEVSAEAFEKIKHYNADSVQVKSVNGSNYFYLYGLSKPDVEYTLVPSGTQEDYTIVQTTQEESDRSQKNPVAAAMINVMQLKYGDAAVFYLDDLEVLASTVLLAASHNEKLGFELGKDKSGRPSLYAAVGLPYKIDDLQKTYTLLFEGVDRNKKTLAFYETPVSTGEKKNKSGYGISLDSINFKSK